MNTIFFFFLGVINQLQMAITVEMAIAKNEEYIKFVKENYNTLTAEGIKSLMEIHKLMMKEVETFESFYNREIKVTDGNTEEVETFESHKKN